MRGLILVILLIGWAEGRVKLTYSEFIDGSDLVAVAQTSFSCPKGCMAYSVTEMATLVILNQATGNEITNLNSIATNNNDKDRSYTYGTTLPAANYFLRNNAGLTGAVFGLYIVHNEAPNYGLPIRVVEEFTPQTFSTSNGVMTIMTRGNGIRLQSFQPNEDSLPAVYATGYDAVNDDCWRIFDASSVSHAQQAQVDSYGPLVTVRFRGSVKAVGDVMSDPPEQRNSLTISSPGFHGCKAASMSAYQYNVNKIGRRFSSLLDGIVNIHVRACPHIAVDADALVISGLQNEPIKIMGEVPYSHDFVVNKVDVGLVWERTMPSSCFAVELDATKSSECASFFAALALSLIFVR